MSGPAAAPEPDHNALIALGARLGHSFQTPALLIEALTHSSLGGQEGAVPRSNERLEFLGDRVLGLVVAELLFEMFPNENEGPLARRHAALVRRETLATVAEEIELGACLRLSPGEDSSGGRQNPALLADACEAVIGAVFLDGGYDTAAAFVRRHWRPRAEQALKPPQDPKTALQEWAQGRGLPLPRYAVIAHEGPAHAPRFVIEACVEGRPPAQGSGPSKRLAERAAAKAMLEAIRAERDG